MQRRDRDPATILFEPVLTRFSSFWHATAVGRPTAVACQKLEKRVKTGSKSIVAGSLSRRCTHVTGVHPEKTLGGTDLWLPSAHSGSFWTPTGCWLPQDQSKVFDTGERADHAETVSRQARGEVLISDTETITLGQIQSRVKLEFDSRLYLT